MKITRRQLRQLIQEGLWDSIKSGYQKAKDMAGDVFDVATLEDFKEWGTDDAVALYIAMEGVGTDEDKIIEVLSKRIDDLDVLYSEFNLLLQKFIEHSDEFDLHRVAVNLLTGFGRLVFDTVQQIKSNHDLIAWLEDDGMDEESELVQAALDAKGIQRSRPRY